MFLLITVNFVAFAYGMHANLICNIRMKYAVNNSTDRFLTVGSGY